MHLPQDSMWRIILKIFWISGWTKQGTGRRAQSTSVTTDARSRSTGVGARETPGPQRHGSLVRSHPSRGRTTVRTSSPRFGRGQAPKGTSTTQPRTAGGPATAGHHRSSLVLDCWWLVSWCMHPAAKARHNRLSGRSTFLSRSASARHVDATCEREG